MWWHLRHSLANIHRWLNLGNKHKIFWGLANVVYLYIFVCCKLFNMHFLKKLVYFLLDVDVYVYICFCEKLIFNGRLGNSAQLSVWNNLNSNFTCLTFFRSLKCKIKSIKFSLLLKGCLSIALVIVKQTVWDVTISFSLPLPKLEMFPDI